MAAISMLKGRAKYDGVKFFEVEGNSQAELPQGGRIGLGDVIAVVITSRGLKILPTVTNSRSTTHLLSRGFPGRNSGEIHDDHPFRHPLVRHLRSSLSILPDCLHVVWSPVNICYALNGGGASMLYARAEKATILPHPL